MNIIDLIANPPPLHPLSPLLSPIFSLQGYETGALNGVNVKISLEDLSRGRHVRCTSALYDHKTISVTPKRLEYETDYKVNSLLFPLFSLLSSPCMCYCHSYITPSIPVLSPPPPLHIHCLHSLYHCSPSPLPRKVTVRAGSEFPVVATRFRTEESPPLKQERGCFGVAWGTTTTPSSSSSSSSSSRERESLLHTLGESQHKLSATNLKVWIVFPSLSYSPTLPPSLSPPFSPLPSSSP